MTLNITMDLDNMAFEDPSEVPRILRALANDLQHAGYAAIVNADTGTLTDVNGNTVGSWEVTVTP